MAVVAAAAAAAPIVRPPEEEGQDSFFPPDTEAFAQFLQNITNTCLDNGRIIGEYLSHGRVFGPRQWRAIGVNIPDYPFPPNINQMARENEFVLFLPSGMSFNQLTAIFQSRFNCPHPVPHDQAILAMQIATLTPGWHIITVTPKKAMSIRQGTFSAPSYMVAAAGAWMAMECHRPLTFGSVRCSEQNSPVITQNPQERTITYSTFSQEQHAAENSLLAGRYDEIFHQWVQSSPHPHYTHHTSKWIDLFESIEHLPYREFWRILCLEAPLLARSILKRLSYPEESMSATNARIEANPALLTNIVQSYRNHLSANDEAQDGPLGDFKFYSEKEEARLAPDDFFKGGIRIERLKHRYPHAFLAIAHLLWGVKGGTFDQAVRDFIQTPNLAMLFTQEEIVHQIDRTEMTPQRTLKDRRQGVDLPPQYALWIYDDDQIKVKDAKVIPILTRLLNRDWKGSAKYPGRDAPTATEFSEYLKTISFNKWVQLGTFLLNNPKFSHLLPFERGMQWEQREGVYLLKIGSLAFYNYSQAIRSIFLDKAFSHEDVSPALKDLGTSAQAITQEDLHRSTDKKVQVKIGNHTFLIEEPMILLTGLPKPRAKGTFPARIPPTQADILGNVSAPRPEQQQQRAEPNLTAEEILDRLWKGDWKNSNWPVQTPDPLKFWELFEHLERRDPKRWVQLGTILLNTPRFAARLQVDPKFLPKQINGISVIENPVDLSYYQQLLKDVFCRKFNCTDHLLDIRIAFEQASQQTLVISQHDLDKQEGKPLMIQIGGQSLEITKPSILLATPPRAFEFAKKMELSAQPLLSKKTAPFAKRPASAAAAAAARPLDRASRLKRIEAANFRAFYDPVKPSHPSSSKAKAAAAATTRHPLKAFLKELDTHGPEKRILSQYYQELCEQNPYQAMQLGITVYLAQDWKEGEDLITDQRYSKLLEKAHQTMMKTPDIFKALGISYEVILPRMSRIMICQESDIKNGQGAVTRFQGHLQVIRTPFVLFNPTRVFDSHDEAPQPVPMNMRPHEEIPSYMLGKPPKPDDKR
jgi:hypothetical protein